MKKYVLAIISGIINGMFGTGGGIIALPMLYDILGDTKKAHQNVVLFILPLSIISAVIYKKNYDIKPTVFLCAGAFLGGIAGALISKKIKVKYLKIIFGIVILYIGVKSILWFCFLYLF